MGLVLNNGKAYIGARLVKCSLLLENGKIEKISKKTLRAGREIDCSGKVILPGAIDVHVHFRTPGFEYKEDWASGSLAALHGGVTTVMDMPNTNPPTDSVQRLEEKRKMIERDADVNFDLYMAATEDNIGEIAKAKNLRAVKLYYGSTTGNILLNRDEKILQLLALSQEKGFVVVAHAEDENIIRKNEGIFRNEKHQWPELHMLVRNDEAERAAIEKLLALQSRSGGHLHIAHLSSKKGLRLIENAKKQGRKVTCEVAPHHLLLSSKDYKKFGNMIKCNPSIKKEEDQRALFSALRRGSIDIVATDHAPHSPEEKKRPYWECPSGIAGVETMLPVLLNQVAKKKLPLGLVVRLVCENPAKIFGWKNKGRIRKGFDADLVVVDMNRTYELSDEKLFTKARFSPFCGVKLKGFVELTICRGIPYG